MNNTNTHLGYWCTSGVCRCTDSPSSYCQVEANKICEFEKNKSNHLSDCVNRSSTYLRNTTTTTIAATTRRNAAPPITEPTSRGSRFWICCECSSVGEKHQPFELITYIAVTVTAYISHKCIFFSLTVEYGLNAQLHNSHSQKCNFKPLLL